VCGSPTPILTGAGMSRKDTLDRAYGNVPREIPDPFSIFDWLPARPIKYFWLKWIVRKIFR